MVVAAHSFSNFNKMSSYLLQTAIGNSGLMENGATLFTNFCKLCFLTILIYVATLKINKSGIFERWSKFKRRAELLNRYPGLGMYPILGSIPKMGFLIFQPCQELLPWLKIMSQEYGPICRLWVFGEPKLYIGCPETAVACLKNGNFPGRTTEISEIARLVGGDGLFTATPDEHGPLKKIWKQWFSRRLINSNLSKFQRESRQFCDALSMKINTTFDVVDNVLQCAFRMVACSAFGDDYVNLIPKDAGKKFSHNLTTISNNLFTRSFRPWLANNFIYFNLTADGRETMRCIKSAQELTFGAIKHGKMLRKDKIRQLDTITYTPCFLDHLLDIHEQGKLTEYQVFQELNDFIAAGYDTSGLSIGWALYLVALHPNCQALIVEELYEIFNGSIKKFSSEITPTHLKNMRYLELCIKETLRLYPASPIIFRQSDPDNVVVMPDGNKIPPGVDTYISVYHIHQDPKYFPEPEKFVPERHLKPIAAYIPFGNGSNGCIGQLYALQELKMILAHLLMEYKWETVEKPGIKPSMSPLCYSENGLRFRISKRNYN